MAEIVVSATDENQTIFGVFRTQELLCEHVGTFVRLKLQAKQHALPVSVISLMALLKTHTPLSKDECRAYQLPTRAKWFNNEMGGLTAFTLLPGAYMVKLYILTQDTNRAAPIDLRTCIPLFGLFKTPELWDGYRSYAPLNHFEPAYPFEENTLEYDRCRCTLMGVKDALHKAPVLTPIPEQDLAALLVSCHIPAARYWFWTEEEALKVAGHTIRWNSFGTILYAVYTNHWDCKAVIERHRLETYKRFPETAAAAQTGSYNYTVISVPEVYGTVVEGWNPHGLTFNPSQ